LGREVKYFFILAVLLCVPAVEAQVLVPTIGASNEYGGQASGGAATLYLPSGDVVYGSLGWGADHFQGGALWGFKWASETVYIGSREFSVGFDGVGEGISLTGFSIERKTGNSDVIVFGGALSNNLTTPFMGGSTPTARMGGGIYATHKYRGFKVSGLIADGKTPTYAVGADYVYHRTLNLTASAGVVNGMELLQGTVNYNPTPQISFFGAHSTFISPYSATSDTGGVNLCAGRWTASGAVNESLSRGTSTRGENVGGGVRVGIVQENVGWYKSGKKVLLNSSTTEDVTHHLETTEVLSRSNGQLSVSAGGAYHNNRLALSVNRNVVFLIDRGYENTTSVNLTLNKGPHDSTLNFSMITTAFGQTLYSTSATGFVPVGLGTTSLSVVHHSSGGKYVVAGTCRDQRGPVAGCAIEAEGGTIAFSNEDGQWSLRVKKADVRIQVLPDIFATMGDFKIISTPNTVHAGSPADIVVKRQ
jgi:hypothetical protein